MTKPKIASASTANLIADVSAKFGELPKKMTKQVLQSFLGAIEARIAAGEKVRIDKVGILQVKDRAARTGRNPQTGQEIKIPASKKVSFRAASTLKEAIGVKGKNKKSAKKSAGGMMKKAS